MLIKARFPNSKCHTCKRVIKLGETVEWKKQIRKIFCLDCFKKQKQDKTPSDRIPDKRKPENQVPNFETFGNETPEKVLETEINTDGKLIQRFKNLNHVMQYVDAKFPQDGTNYVSIGSRQDDKVFCETSYEQAREYLEHGNEQDYNISSKLVDSIFADVAAKMETDEVMYDVTGTEIDVAVFTQGIPECWQYIEQRRLDIQGQRLIHVIYNAAVSASVSTTQMIKRGSMCMALVELLELSGHRVKLDLVCSETAYNSMNVTSYISLKEYDERLDKHRVAYALVNPSMFRRIYFACIEHMPLEYRKALGSTYGRPTDLPQNETEVENCIYFPCQLSSDGLYVYGSTESLEAKLKQDLQKYGVRFKDDTKDGKN